VGCHRGLWLYWPRSDEVSVATACSLHQRGKEGGGRWGLGDPDASMSGCGDVFICLCPTKSSASLLGSADRSEARAHHGRYVFLSVYVLLNLFLPSTWGLSPCWEMTGRQEGGGKSQFCSTFPVARKQWQSSCHRRHSSGNTQGNYSLCVAFCMLRLFIVASQVSALDAHLEKKKKNQLLSWQNAQHFYLNGSHRASWCRVRGWHTSPRLSTQ